MMRYGMIYITRWTMAEAEKARVFMSGRSQAVRIPAEYRFTSNEVFIRRDPQSGDVILSQAPDSWDDVYAALDKAGFPDDFLADRNQGPPQDRDEL
jgi:antitoxin VapB